MGYKSQQYLDSTELFKEVIVSILAKQERVWLSERTKAGMACRVAQGVRMGPPAKSQEQVEQMRRLKGGG